jgi:serine/threonine protein kinase/tetratricopeptide (TPR) repeat protein
MMHLNEDTVLDFFRGTLPEGRRSRVEGHIDHCAECRQLISSLSEGLAPTLSANAPTDPDGSVDWHAGTVVAGRFEIEDHVGTGGMGTIFRARDRVSGDTVAIKAMLDVHGDEGRFEREARVLSELRHPAIVRYVAHGSTRAGQAYLAMEWLDGEDLGSRLAREPLQLVETVRLIRRVLEGLAAAHASGVVHRDVKPGNIFLVHGATHAAKLIDFGVARSDHRGVGATRAGALLGTPGYMAPEQARGGSTLDGRADVFSLGCVLYECLTGTRAFAGADLLEVLAKLLLETPRAPSDLRPELPATVDDLVLRMLEKDATKRPTACLTIASELARIESQATLAGSARSRPTFDSASWRRRLERGTRSLERRLPKRRALAAAGLVGLALAALGVGRALRQSSASSVAPSPTSGISTGTGLPADVLILGIDNRTSDPLLDGTLDTVLTYALGRSRALSALSGPPLRRLAMELRPEPEKIDERLGQALAAHYGKRVVTIRGAVAPKDAGYSVSLIGTEAATGAVLVSATRDARSADRIVPTVGLLACDIRRALGDPLPEDPLAEERTDLSLSIEADHELSVGLGLGNAGDYDEGILHLRRATALDPGLADAHMGLAIFLSSLALDGDAIKEARLGVKELGGLGDFLRLKLLANYYWLVGDYDRSIPAFAEALSLRPLNVSLAGNLAMVYAMNGNLDRALELSHRVALEHPKYVIGRSNVAAYEFLAGHFEEARRQAEEVVHDFPHPTVYAYVYLALAKIMLGDEAGGLAIYDTLGGLDASLAAIGRADLAIADGRLADADDLLQRSLAVDGADKDAIAPQLAMLGEVLAQRGDTPGANRAADKAALSASASARFAAAEVFLTIKQEKKALALAGELTATESRDGRMYAKLIEGDAARLRGALGESVASFSDAQRIGDSWWSHRGLGMAALARGAFADAEREFRTCLARSGEGAAAYSDNAPTVRHVRKMTYYLARALDGLRRPDARTTYQAFLALETKAQHDPMVEDARRRTLAP